MGVIYKITSPSGKKYVGKTHNLSKRISCYKCVSKKNGRIILHNSIYKYGWDAHKLEIIENVKDSLLNEREIFWIAELKTYCYENNMGLNMTKGGEGQRVSWKHDLLRVEKQKERFRLNGANFKGKKHLESTKKIISQKASERNKITGCKIPKWGVEKGRKIVRKPVLVYGIDGIFITEFISVTAAAFNLNINPSSISAVSKGNHSNTNGYVFRYKSGECYPLKITVEVKQRTIKRSILLLSELYEVMCEYPSAKEASDFWKIPKGTINRAAMYNYLVPIRTGHIFIYKDLYEEILKRAS